MQNSSKDIEFLFSEIISIKPKLKNLSILEKHIGKKVIDLIMFKPKRLISAKVCNNLDNTDKDEDVIIEIKVIKHYQNYFNKRMPYKISALFKDKKITS